MPEPPLRGQNAIVTGASSGIGEAIARALAAAGAAVVVNYVRDGEAAARVVSDIHAAGGTAMAVQADVSREDDVTAMFQTMLSAWSSVDILVNNGGLQRDAPATEM